MNSSFSISSGEPKRVFSTSASGESKGPHISRELGTATNSNLVQDNAKKVSETAPAGSTLQAVSSFVFGTSEAIDLTRQAMASDTGLSGKARIVARAIGLALSGVFALLGKAIAFTSALATTVLVAAIATVSVVGLIYLVRSHNPAEKLTDLGKKAGHLFSWPFNMLSSVMTAACAQKTDKPSEALSNEEFDEEMDDADPDDSIDFTTSMRMFSGSLEISSNNLIAGIGTLLGRAINASSH